MYFLLIVSGDTCCGLRQQWCPHAVAAVVYVVLMTALVPTPVEGTHEAPFRGYPCRAPAVLGPNACALAQPSA